MKKMSSFAELGSLVYSTETGSHCPECAKSLPQCQCDQQEEILGDGHVRVQRESKGRGGKTVKLITGLPVTATQLKEICTALKKRCGVGGAVKGAQIEIQGEQIDSVLSWLKQQGYQAKRSGG